MHPLAVFTAGEGKDEPQAAEQADREGRDEDDRQAIVHVADHQQHRGRDREAHCGEPADRHDVRGLDQVLLLMLTEHQPVIGDGGQEQGRRDGREQQAGDV